MQNFSKSIGILFFLFILTGCSSKDTQAQENPETALPSLQITNFPKFDRSDSFQRLKNKMSKKEPLVIHVLVPLCDNEHQGIVRVNERLGDGLNLQSNLYWGALYGIKSYFKRLSDWELIYSEKNVADNILERIIFKKTFSNGTTTIMVADAYRGDEMQTCLIDYFNSIRGIKKDSIEFEGKEIGINSKADLLIFNGHNGLMDHNIDYSPSADGIIREAAIIGCISFEYFNKHLKHSQGYPILTTTNLLAPEAYVLEGLINSWSQLQTGDQIRQEAGKAYHKYQKCGLKGATRLFKTGW